MLSGSAANPLSTERTSTPRQRGQHNQGLHIQPAVRVSTQRALHGSCRGLVRAAWAQGWEQVVEPVTRVSRPTVKHGLHLRYPQPRTDPSLLGWFGVRTCWGITVRWRIFRHCSLHSLLGTTAVLRHVTGSPGLGLLRRLRPIPDRSGRRCAQPRWPRWRRGQGGRPGTVPVFTC